MASSLRITVTGQQAAMAGLQGRQERIRQQMTKAMQKALNLVYRRVMENLTGAVLKVDTGRLRQSWAMSATENRGMLGTNVEYAAIHEFGGKIPAHTITARGKAMRFVNPRFIGPVRMTKKGKIAKGARSGVIFATTVQHPGAIMPPRPFMRPALRDSMEEINQLFRAGMAAALGKGA